MIVTVLPAVKDRKGFSPIYISSFLIDDEIHDPGIEVSNYRVRIERLAKRRAQPFGGKVDWKDLCSVGLMAVVDACSKYTKTAGASFTTYAFKRVNWQMSKEIEKVMKYLDYDMVEVSINDEYLSGAEVQPPENLRTSGSEVFSACEMSEQVSLLKTFLSDLPEKQAEILRRMYFDGASSNELADEIGVSRQYILQVKDKALGGLKNKFLEAGYDDG